MLCYPCKALITDILGGKINVFSSWEVNRDGPGDRPYEPLEHISEQYASKTCDLCRMFLETHYVSYNDGANYIQQLPLSGTVSVCLNLGHKARRPWSLFLMTNTRPEFGGFYARRETYEFFTFGKPLSSEPRPKFPGQETPTNQLDMDLTQPVRDSVLVDDQSLRSDSKSCADMVENWSLSCKETHPCCSRRRQNQPLPTRVLDVGTTGSSHEPFLFETNTEQGIYTTLSHRWGNMSQQFRTTKATFNQYRIRIPLPAFPKLFHDAILVTRQLGIRYLWIDCLCIVQDDDDDWQRECEKMARIYENSFLTLSALLPTSKGSGLFQSRWQRVEPVTFRMLDGTVIGLRPSMPTLTNAVGRSVLNTRGWILQERILSPAVLHFGDSQLYWECVGGQSEEIYPVLQNHASGLMKNMLEEAQRPGSQLYPRGHYIAWYNMVMEYTRKQLTVETDRLTAILGLSERFGRVFGGTFVAGLWAQDLHRGLLWRDLTKDGFAGCKRHVARGDRKHIIAPSWSWVQNGAQVDFEWDLSFEFPSRIHAVTRLPSSTDTEIIGTRTWKCRNGHRGSVKGYIQMWCVVKRVRWVSRTVERDGKSHDDKDIKVTKSLDVLQRTIGDTELELPCLMDLDFQEPRDCYCAIIADWTFEDSWKEFFKRETESLDLRCYLVLERTRKAPRNGNPQDLGKLKRIGVGAANIPSVEQFFGNRRKHFLTIV